MKITVDQEKCIGCGTCVALCKECFELKNGLSHVKEMECQSCNVKEVAQSCPVDAIIVEE